MEKILKSLVGKKVDINSSGAITLRGENTGVDGEVLTIRDEEGKIYFIAVAMIVAVSEVVDSTSRPGFIG